VLDQIALVRQRSAANPLAAGHLHFSMTALAANRERIADRLREGPYAQPALPPATPWLAEPPPAAPEVALTPLTPLTPSGAARVAWRAPAGSPPWRWLVLQVMRQGRWEVLHLPAPGVDHHMLDPGADRAVLHAVGRTGIQGAAATLVQRSGAWSRAA
jgi:hypothetical protein